MNTPPVVLSIAGYDPSSGAGMTADIKTIAAHGCYGLTCITALTVQNTTGVHGTEPVRAEIVRRMLEDLASDFQISAVRVGMLGFGETPRTVAEFLEQARLRNVVVDPIVRSTSGADLVSSNGQQILRERLMKLADVVTPNLEEAEALTGMPVRTIEEMRAAATKLREMGAKSVVITGGHLEVATDLMSWNGSHEEFKAPKVHSKSTHGTGCAFATAIACGLATGKNMRDAVIAAKVYVGQAIEKAYTIGQGIGPVNHMYRLVGATERPVPVEDPVSH